MEWDENETFSQDFETLCHTAVHLVNIAFSFFFFSRYEKFSEPSRQGQMLLDVAGSRITLA